MSDYNDNKENGWHCAEMASHVAVYPDYEDGHVIEPSGTCWCKPEVEMRIDYSKPLVTHSDESQRKTGVPLTDSIQKRVEADLYGG